MDAPDKKFTPKPVQQIIAFEFRRNQMFDLIKSLKLMVKDYDDPDKPGRFVVGRVMANSHFVVDIGLDRLKDESHPLQKSLLKDFMKSKEKKQDAENVQPLPKPSDSKER